MEEHANPNRLTMRAYVRERLGLELTDAEIDALDTNMEAWCREHGYPVVTTGEDASGKEQAMAHHPGFPGIPYAIPTAKVEDGEHVYTPTHLCDDGEARFYLGYLVHQMLRAIRAATDFQAYMASRFGQAPDIPEVVHNAHGRSAVVKPPWVTPQDIEAYKALVEEEED